MATAAVQLPKPYRDLLSHERARLKDLAEKTNQEAVAHAIHGNISALRSFSNIDFQAALGHIEMARIATAPLWVTRLAPPAPKAKMPAPLNRKLRSLVKKHGAAKVVQALERVTHGSVGTSAVAIIAEARGYVRPAWLDAALQKQAIDDQRQHLQWLVDDELKSITDAEATIVKSRAALVEHRRALAEFEATH